MQLPCFFLLFIPFSIMKYIEYIASLLPELAVLDALQVCFSQTCLPAPSNVMLMSINSLFYVCCPWLFFYLVQILSLTVLLTWNIWSYTHLLFFGSCNCNLIVSFFSSSSEFLFSLICHNPISGKPNLISCPQCREIFYKTLLIWGKNSIYFILFSLKDLLSSKTYIFIKIFLNSEEKTPLLDRGWLTEHFR